MTVSPRLPQPVQALWGEVRACRRCLLDPTLGPQLSEDTYVPFPTIGLLPPDAEHATYVLVGAEPSGGWVKSRSQLEARIELGLRNFGDGREAGSVHYAVERWLLRPGEGYYFTDLSKCTVPVKVAEKTRERRYALCSEYLFREIAGIKPRAIVAIGREAYRYLRDHRQPDWPAVFSVLHYSIQAQSYRKQLLVGDWRSQGPTLAELDAFIDARRLALHDKPFKKVTSSYLELLAAYRVQFTAIRNMIDEGRYAKDEPAMVSVATSPA